MSTRLKGTLLQATRMTTTLYKGTRHTVTRYSTTLLQRAPLEPRGFSLQNYSGVERVNYSGAG
jgi:hypothetical protein